MAATKQDIISKLREDILALEGFRPQQSGKTGDLGLGPIAGAFPNGAFPTGAIHEFISSCPEDTAACGGFIAGLTQELLKDGGACLWISYTRRIYPPALKLFGVDPDRVIFVDVPRQHDVLWVTEEALKCEGVATVVAETRELDIRASRRLQLAVEQSRITGFILRKDVKNTSNNSCVARWKITHVPSLLEEGIPGVGFPRWQVELLKVRNGNPGSWTVEWSKRKFRPVLPLTEKENLRRYA